MPIYVTCKFAMLIFKGSQVNKYYVMFAFLFVQTVYFGSFACLAQFYFLAIKPPNCLIYVAIYSHLYRIFVALCGSRKLNCNVSAKGSRRRVRDGFATYAMTWRLFCEDFCRTKSITCLKLSRTVRDQFAMHAWFLRSNANVKRHFANRLAKQS